MANSFSWELFVTVFSKQSLFSCLEIISQTCVMILTIKSMICHSFQCPLYSSKFPELKQVNSRFKIDVYAATTFCGATTFSVTTLKPEHST